MSWKNWPYWVRGGVISSIIFLIIASLSYSGINIYPVFVIFAITFIMLNFLGSPFFSGDCGISKCPTSFGIILVVLIWAIIFFIIGAIIGLIVGKIKAKK